MIPEILEAYFHGPKSRNDESLRATVQTLGLHIDSQLSKGFHKRHKGQLRASDATKCSRKSQYASLNVEGEPISFDSTFKMLMGNMLEAVVLHAVSLVRGMTIAYNNADMIFDIGGRKREGHVDGVLSYKGDRFHLEMKSMNANSFRWSKKKGIDDGFGYLGQAEVYHRGLKEKGLINQKETIFLLIDRNQMKMSEVRHAYTGRYASLADKKFALIDKCNEEKKLAPRDYLLNDDGTLPMQCSYCSYKHACWTEPVQHVTYDLRGEPVYQIQPTRELKLSFGKKNAPTWTLT